MNILIVDDDIMICNLLSMLIKQIEDFTGVVFSVSSADEAERFCDGHPIDLVITDITMPNRSGLDLIRALRARHPKIQIACLSAYDDYDYIREALKLGVLDYILKSEMKLEDIISLFGKVESFSGISRDVDPPEEELSVLNKTNELMEAFLEEDDSQAEEICSRMDCHAEDGVVVVGFQLCRQAASADIMLKAQRIAEKTRASELKPGLCFVCEGARIVMLLKDLSDSMESREDEMMKLGLFFKRNLYEYSGQNVVLSLYEVAQSFGQLRDTITKTTDIMDAYEYYPNYEKATSPLKNLSEHDAKRLRHLMESNADGGTLATAAEHLLQYVQEWHRSFMIPREVKSAAVCGLFYLMECNEQRGPESLLSYNRYARRMRYSRNQDTLERLLSDALAAVAEGPHLPKRAVNASVERAVKYINANYAHKITLDDLAKHIYLNRTYASQMFKKYMNVNFADYLEMVRINKAKELLLYTHLPITEVAVRVGYSNQSYFTKVFKRSTGLSPNTFRTIAKK